MGLVEPTPFYYPTLRHLPRKVKETYMKIWRVSLLLLWLVACAQAPIVEESATAVIQSTTTAPPTHTSEPTQPPPTVAPTETPESAPTAAPEPTATATVADDVGNDGQSLLQLYSETAVIEREPNNKYLNGGAVIYHDGQFHMFSNFFNSWPGKTVTYYYTSPDGQTWTRSLAEPLFTIDDVPLDGTGALVLSGLVQPDGTWVLYYHTFTANSQPGTIGRATANSPTGPWHFDETAVLSPGSQGEWDDGQVMRVNVLPHENGYVMYYAGVNKQGQSSIGLAFSTDGITWEKYNDPTTTDAPYSESDPIMEPELTWEGRSLGRPEVVQTADGWIMLYEGGGGNQTGLAISQDGIHFARDAANPILTRDNMVNGFTFFQGALFYENNTYYYLIEAGNGPVGTDIFLYTMKSPLATATSGNLTFNFSLQRDKENPALAHPSSGWDAAWTFSPGVVYHDEKFHMFFTGWDYNNVIRIGYAVSDNGLDFERVTDSFVLEYEPDKPNVGIWTPVPLVLEDGTWVLYVNKNENKRITNEILRATAPAPTGPWTWDETPVYTADPAGWDAQILPESMARTPDGGYIIAYETNWCTNSQVGMLFSDDGLTWEAYNDPTTNEKSWQLSDPVLSPTGVEEDWDRQALTSPLIFATDTGYELFYIGQYRNIGSKMSKFDWSWLGYATSADGSTWQRYTMNPVIELERETGCPWMSGLKVDDTYYLYLALRAGADGIGVITGTITPNP